MAHEQDYIERIHQTLYKYIRGNVYQNQYVGTVKLGEEELEEVFHGHGIGRNPLAYWKQHEDGRDSTGSWRMTSHNFPDLVDDGMQVHLTLFVNQDNTSWIDIFAHYEDSWSHSLLAAIRHLRESNFSTTAGVNKARKFFFNQTYLKLYDKQ